MTSAIRRQLAVKAALALTTAVAALSLAPLGALAQTPKAGGTVHVVVQARALRC